MSFSYSTRSLRQLHSFPTRRSSDLAPPPGRGGGAPRAAGIGVGAPARRRDEQRRRGGGPIAAAQARAPRRRDRKSTRLNSSHPSISYAVFCLKKNKHNLRQSYYTHQ